MKTIHPIIAAGLLGCVCLAGCASEKKTAAAETTKPVAAMGAINSKCPISGEAIDGKTTASFQGKTVGFCCGNCASKWNAMSDADKQAKFAAATKMK